MAFQFFLDDQLTDQPNNDRALTTTIKRDSDLGAFLTTQDVTLEYSGKASLAAGLISGYTYLKNKFESGTCLEVRVDIYDRVSATETYRVYSGVIKVPAIEIEQGYERLTTKIDDNSFYAYVKNNRNVKFSLYATHTKNGEDITPPDIYRCDFFYGQTGIYLSVLGALYRGYRIYDVMKFLVPAISDNKVTFESDYLSSMEKQLFIFDGYALAHPNTDPNVNVSFQEIVDELFKLKNTSFYIDQTDPLAPVLRLEEASWFFVDSDVYSFDEPLHIRTSVKTNKLHGTVKVGSEYNPGGAAPVYTSNAQQSYFGWKEEVYTPYGQCNTDAELNLISRFAIANNAVNDQVSGVVGDTNAEMMFIVEMENVDTGAFTADAARYEIFGNGNKRFYNVGLNNVNKISFHGGNFQTALSNTQDPGQDICHVSLGQDMQIANFNTATNGGTGSPYLLSPIPFADEFGGNNYDGGNNYNNTQYYYTAPLDGNYSFAMELNIEVVNTKRCISGAQINNPSLVLGPFFTEVAFGVEVKYGLEFYTDNTFTTAIGVAQQTFRTSSDGFYTLNIGYPVTLPAGAAVRAFTLSKTVVFAPQMFGSTPLASSWVIINCIYSTAEPNRIIYANADSFFECNGTPDGALVLAEPDPALYKVKMHEFNYPISASDFRTIQALPIGKFKFIKDGVERSGYIEQLQYNNWDGSATIKLISEDATT